MRTTKILLIALIIPLGYSGRLKAQAPLTQAVHDAFVANRASFEFGVVKFEYAKGKSSDAAAARLGQLDPSYALLGTYAFHGEEARLDSIFSEELMRQTTRFIGNNMAQSTLVSFRAATNGEVSVLETFDVSRARSGFTRTLKMVSGNGLFLSCFEFPLSLGQPEGQQADNLGLRLREVLKGNPDYRVAGLDSDADYEGRGVIKVSVESSSAREDYWVDLARGAVPLKVEVHIRDGGSFRLGSVIFNDDLTRIPDRGWLPLRRSWYYPKSKEGGRYVIAGSDFAKAPSRASLGLDFEGPVALRNESTRLSYSPRKFWDLSKLPPPGSSGVVRSQPPSIPMDHVPQLPGEQVPPRNFALIGLGVIASLSLIGYRIWMRRGS